MSMDTNLQGRLRNTKLRYSSGLMPLYEAVVNSIHAIEEAGIGNSDACITVHILRGQQQSLALLDSSTGKSSTTKDAILGFRIVDNGIGFNDENMASFRLLDSEHKVEIGGRGVGRLLWLKAFKRISVVSTFRANDMCMTKRTFSFNSTKGVFDEADEVIESCTEVSRNTEIHLDGFDKRYRNATAKTATSIANSLFEHCLWYFIRDAGVPEIIVCDGDETISLSQVYKDHMATTASSETISIKSYEFSLTHIHLKSSIRSHAIALCAASRLVMEESLSGKIPGLFGRLEDGDSQFIYLCFVASTFLDDAVRAERTGFDISEETSELFADTEISLAEIKARVSERAAHHLQQYLVSNMEKSKRRVEEFVATKAPRYRPILSRIPKDKLGIDPNISDKELEITLHKQLAEIELTHLANGQEIMEPMAGEELPDYRKRIDDYLKTAEDIKKSDLANYVFHRKVILDLLSKAIQKTDDGKYVREELIHKLIMPMRCDSHKVRSDNCNLWLIDERLAFHDYLGSDKSIASMPITGSSDPKEPDICSLKVYDNPILVSDRQKPPLASIVVVEIKRPMRNDASEGEDKDPIEQALGYLNRIRQGKVTTSSGRPIPNSEHIPGFCYIICDITDSIIDRCNMHDAVSTDDKLGFFYFHKKFNAYVEIVSFDRLVNAAQERNRAFFDKLGLPAT